MGEILVCIWGSNEVKAVDTGAVGCAGYIGKCEMDILYILCYILSRYNNCNAKLEHG